MVRLGADSREAEGDGTAPLGGETWAVKCERYGVYVYELSEKEKNLIELVRAIEHGEVKIFIQDKQPIRVEEIKKSIKL